MNSAEPACEAVLIIGFGGPTSPDEIRPFLDRVLMGRPVQRERYEEVVRHYEALGGRSPYNELTARQATALDEALDHLGIHVPVAVGMRNAPPYLEDALRDLGARGVKRALGFILAAHRSDSSWDQYQRDVAHARVRVGIDAPEVDYPAPWHNHPWFIEAAADRVRAALVRLPQERRARAELIFTAHSIPAAMAACSPYVDQLDESARLVAAAVGHDGWTLAFQSRSGNPRDPWLEPDIGDALRSRRGGAAVVMPIGFLCNHVEVLYDLDVSARKIACDAGVTMERAETVGAHPRFIDMMASIARSHLRR